MKKIALKIRKHDRSLTKAGFAFFLLAIICGIFWLLFPENNVLEPITFVLIVCCDIFWGLPKLSEFISPSRKSIKDMTDDEILIFVSTTNHKEDWSGVSLSEEIREMFLKEYPSLRFKVKYTGDGIQNKDFKDRWANCYPKPHAVGYWYDLYKDANLIKRFILVSVDGGNALLPTPEIVNSNIVSPLNYKVAQIHDNLNSLDKYMKSSGLSL